MKIALYARVSTQLQALTQTIEQQLARLQAYCLNQGWTVADEVIFRDAGYSGADLKRPGLDRLRDAVGRASFDRVLITAPDRLARNYVHQVLLLEEFSQANCEIVFVDHPLSHDPHDQLVLQIRGAVAEYERTLITERTRRGLPHRLELGQLLPWSRMPYGYRGKVERPRDPQGLHIEPSEAAIVAELYTLYAQTQVSLSELATQLNQRGIPSPKGKTHWNASTIRWILQNPVYIGQVCIHRIEPTLRHNRRSALQPVGHNRESMKVTSADHWLSVAHSPVVVSNELFEPAQPKFEYNKQLARRNKKHANCLLYILVSCGLCQHSCRSFTRDGYSYYWCTGRQPITRTGQEKRCASHNINAFQLDQLVWQDLCNLITQPSLILQALKRVEAGKWLPQELQSRRANLRKGATNLTQQLERLTEGYLSGIIGLEEYTRRRRDIEQRQQSLIHQERELESQLERHQKIGEITASIEEFCQRVQQGLAEADFQQKRQLVELLIDRVVVSNEDVEIRYVVPTSPFGERTKFCN